MRVTEVDVESILYFDPSEKKEAEEKAKYNKSFFARLFGSVNTIKDTEDPYWKKIDRYGRDTLERELYGDVIGYSDINDLIENGVVFTENFIIFPALDILRFDEILKFGMFNPAGTRLYKFIMDRMGQPCDPDKLEQFREEEPDDSWVKLEFVTKDGKLRSFSEDIEVEYRKEFVGIIRERSGAQDLSTEDVLEGKFDWSYIEGIE